MFRERLVSKPKVEVGISQLRLDSTLVYALMPCYCLSVALMDEDFFANR